MPDDMEFAQLSARVATLERAVEFLLAQIGSQSQSPVSPSPSNFLYPDVIELKRQGKVIEAIKAYRLKTDAGLAEAKQFVDNLRV